MIIRTSYCHFYTRMENTHTSHFCFQSHQNFHTRLSSNKTLLFLIVNPLVSKKRCKHGWNVKVGKLLCLLSQIALIGENNCSDSCFTKIGGKITNGCVLLTFDIGFKSYTYCSSSKFVKRSPSFSTFGAS
jgi:hypothetical protein